MHSPVSAARAASTSFTERRAQAGSTGTVAGVVGELGGTLEGRSGTPLLPPTGNPPSTFRFKEARHREAQLRVRGRKCRRKKEIWGTEKDEKGQKGTKQHRLTGITVGLPHAMACCHLDVLELKASVPWSKEIIWVIYGWGDCS